MERRSVIQDTSPLPSRQDAGHPAVSFAYERCARLDSFTPQGRKPLQWGGTLLVPHGPLLKPAPGPSPKLKVHHSRSTSRFSRLTLGILADTKEALPATLKQLEEAVRQFRRAKVSAVVVLGGIDSTYEGIRTVLTHLQGAEPILALPGDRESRSGFQAAVGALGPMAVDLSQVRGMVVPGTSFIAVPGYYRHHHLFAREQGCSYDADDIRLLIPMARQLPAPRILLSHGPPKGSGVQATDRAFGGVNIGDPLLRRLMQDAEIRFGFFAHVQEAAGHATTLAGRPVGEMEWSDSLLLNVGAADSVPHENLAGAWSKGTAAVVELRREKARYRMVHFH